MTVRVLALAALTLAGCASTRPETPARDLVVLVHGMGRTPLSMAPLAIALQRAGYRVLNVGYDSQRPGVAEIGAALGDRVARELAAEPAPRVHYVGHSLGTVVIRWHLLHDPPPGASRVVMLAPPNQGAASADRFAALVGWALPPIRELGASGGTAAELGPLPDVAVAVVAGDRDGKVAVAETCLDGAQHRVVPSGHTALMWRPRVLRLVRGFLDTGELAGASDAACTDEAG
ncbi:esterase/lipase family protein [Rubrivirga sp. IMCC45206]|uniref:esterase/lipase family protein n=1 Tax=Rubrivirga sp. IMCC45206 TaxID=3391614 RepID=UPI0039902CD4